MNKRILFTVYRKELCEVLRDRRTLVSMFLVPTVIMPMIMFLFTMATRHVTNTARAEVPRVGVLGGSDSPTVLAALHAQAGLVVNAAPADWSVAIAEKRLRAVVEIPAGFEAALADQTSAQVKVYHYEGEFKSGLAVTELRRFFNELRDRALAERLVAHGLPTGFARPFEIRVENVAPPAKVGGNTFGGVIPYLLILLCFSGVIYPAIDLMAGEKERGTLETLLCSPAARSDLVVGKFLAVLTVALTTVACSLASLAGSLGVAGAVLLGSGQVAGLAAGSGATALPTLDLLGMGGALVLVVPLAVLFAALALAISLFARTQKEAQTYLMPLAGVVILPAMAGLLPGVELNSALALVPVLNVTLACKELVSGVWPWTQLVLIFGSTCVYAGAALAACVAMFSRESVVFRS